jgi:hypothetical protein
MNLSERAIAVLRSATKKRNFTAAVIAKLDYHDVLCQPGCGTKRMNEIEEWLARQHLTFRVQRRPLAVILRNTQP